MTQRQLAAIMFTDIVGYTSLMGKDTDKALELIRVSKEIQKPLVKKHNGKWLKEMGDGAMAQFNTALDAMNCAIEIQKSARGELDAKLRIGIHLGDVHVEENDVHGDGVNVASRLESIADPGGIYISDAIQKAIQGQTDVQAKYLGEVKLKNVAYGVRTYAVQGTGLPVPEITGKKRSSSSLWEKVQRRGAIQAGLIGLVVVIMILYLYPKYFTDWGNLESADDYKSIAVLPFVNMSNDKEQDYFCDGITEDIINDLTRLEELHVVARTSSFAFRDKNQDIREIGLKLGAQTIVEGSVRKIGNSLRITVQLINVSNGYHLWSKRYDRELKDVFAIQNEIAENIAQALEIKLSKEKKQVLGRAKTQDIQAYDFYLRGRDYFHQRNKDKRLLSILMFRKAIQKDENYALAYTGLADSYSWIYMFSDGDNENLLQALAASQKALELDPNLAEAHSSRGIALGVNKQYSEAEKEFELAIQLNPKLFDPYYEYGRICKAQGKHDQAAKLFEKAIQVRPEDYEAALYLVTAYDDLNMESEMKEANQRALEIFRKHLDLYPDDSRALQLGALSLIRADKQDEAIRWIEQAVSINPNEVAVLYNAACVYSKAGKIDRALDYFERLIEAGFPNRDWIDSDSDLDPIRDHPRFQKILKTMN